MNWFGKKVSKVNRLESESVITPQTNGRRCSHLMASLLKQIFHLHLGFLYHKMLHIVPTKVRNEQREKHSSWVKTIKAAINPPSMSYPRAKPTRFKSTLTSGERLLWYFWRAMLEVKKKTRQKSNLPESGTNTRTTLSTPYVLCMKQISLNLVKTKGKQMISRRSLGE